MSSRLSSLLHKVQPAGVILFARNITGTGQTYRLLRDCQKCVATPLFTCVDLEGGTVDRFRDVLGPAPSAADVFATGNRKLFRKHGHVLGACCRALGFNVDFAPVLDLAFAASRGVMSSRVVSADPRKVVTYAREFLRGLGAAGMRGCGKHFPGLGESTLDTHRDLPSVNKPMRKLWVEDLLPYRTLRREMPFVMVAHAAYPAVTGDRTPASLSQKWITGILRKKIGYRGLICSDDLEMGGVLAAAPIERAVTGHIRAGGDLTLICHSEELVTRGYEALLRAAETDRRFRARVVEATRRVQKLKRKFFASHRRNALRPTSEKTERLTRRLWEFGEEVRMARIERDEMSDAEPDA